MTESDASKGRTSPPAHESPDRLTILEVPQKLRCSKAHVCNVVNGKVRNAPRLPAIRMGRRILIRRETLELWKRASEQGTEIDAMIPPSEKSAVDAWKEEFHA
jgi:hypothetical protein